LAMSPYYPSVVPWLVDLPMTPGLNSTRWPK
jgi:hypothetical protein